VPNSIIVLIVVIIIVALIIIVILFIVVVVFIFSIVVIAIIISIVVLHVVPVVPLRAVVSSIVRAESCLPFLEFFFLDGLDVIVFVEVEATEQILQVSLILLFTELFFELDQVLKEVLVVREHGFNGLLGDLGRRIHIRQHPKRGIQLVQLLLPRMLSQRTWIKELNFLVSESENLIEQLEQRPIESVVVFIEKCFIHDAVNEPPLHFHQLVQVTNRVIQIILIKFPGTFEDLDHDVVVNGRDEVKHLVVAEVEAVENVLHPSDPFKFLDVLLIRAPRLRKLMLDPL